MKHKIIICCAFIISFSNINYAQNDPSLEDLQKQKIELEKKIEKKIAALNKPNEIRRGIQKKVDKLNNEIFKFKSLDNVFLKIDENCTVYEKSRKEKFTYNMDAIDIDTNLIAVKKAVWYKKDEETPSRKFKITCKLDKSNCIFLLDNKFESEKYFRLLSEASAREVVKLLLSIQKDCGNLPKK